MALKREPSCKTGIHIGVGFVNTTTNGGDDFVDDPQQVLFVFERDVVSSSLPRRSTKIC